jgi:hypothetical protein
VILLLTFATLAISRVVQAHSAVVTVAHEAARAGALASNPQDAAVRMQNRAATVATGLGLDARVLQLRWDLSRFADSPGQVEATIEYTVNLGDLPVVGGALSPTLRADHVEWLDPYRSGLQPEPDGAR